MTLKELEQHFKGVQWRGKNSFQCSCPTHEDKKPSLTVSFKNGKILFHCHAGCNTADILEAVGLEWSDIIGKEKISYEWRDKLGYGISQQAGEECRFVDEYKYTDENGKYLYSKVRYEGGGKKYIRYVIVDEKKDCYIYPPQGFQHTLYRLPRLIRAVQDGYPVYYVEGEKDVETLRKLGYTAATAGGAGDWRTEYAKYFKGATVIVLEDNDAPGQKLREQVVRDLLKYAFIVKWTTTSEQEHGDVTDYINEGRSKEDLEQLLAAASAQGNYKYPPWVYTTEDRQGNVKVHIQPAQLAKGIAAAVDYIQLRSPNSDKETVYVYENGVYSPYNNNMLNGMIGDFIPTRHISLALLNNTRGLLLADKSHVRKHDNINTEDRYINFRNGLYDIKNRRLIQHTPEVVYTYQINADYEADSREMPVFDKFMNDLCTSDGVVDESKKALLQEWTGLLISNIPVYKVKQCLILYSPLGNTGKSQYLGLLSDIVGVENTAAVELQKLSDERGNKFALSYLFGKRLNIVGDQQHVDIGASSVFKQLTGGDAINCEPKGQAAFSYKFRGGLVFACNDLPSFTDDKGGHLFERMCVVPCCNPIPKEKRIGDLLSLMLKEKSAIINWALAGLHRLINNKYKFTECAGASQAAEEYREDIDTLHRYLKAYYAITGNNKDRIKKTEFDERYWQWCIAEEVQPLSKRNIKQRMIKNGIVCGKYVGEFYYKGVAPIIPY
ncbi:MAG: phage/plasmid primase, P4 family [bacterium]|nr:phage/plasmid primase, P4 family [bacterium]